jgi:hypothetical protein
MYSCKHYVYNYSTNPEDFIIKFEKQIVFDPTGSKIVNFMNLYNIPVLEYENPMKPETWPFEDG